MKRRDFLKKSALTAAGSLVLPYILPSGRLFAATGSRRANKVVFCLFAGGVRNLESMQMAEGNLMRYTLNGSQGISGDIAGGMTYLPNPNGPSLQSFGTLFKQFKYAQGPTGHYNGHTTAITGRYSDEAIKLKEPPQYPTVFEYYRKHSGTGSSALNAWWISDSLGPYPYLNFSVHSNYGPVYGANAIQASSLFSSASNSVLGSPINFQTAELSQCDLMRDVVNSQFRKSTINPASIVNTPADAARVQSFTSRMMLEASQGVHANPWGVSMNGDMTNVYAGIQVMKEFQPELMVINMQGIDVGHVNFTSYCDNIRRADFALYKLWEAIQSTPGMANDTILVVAPEHGRNQQANTVRDVYGRYALDHTNDQMSREIFCLIAGPAGVVKQNQVISNVAGESIDLVPTIANVLGFDTAIPVGLLPGRVLTEAFI